MWHRWDDYLYVVPTVSAAFAFLACLTFVVAYHWHSRGNWRRSTLGRSIMSLVFALVAALGAVLSVRVFGNFPGRVALVTAVYLGIGLAAIRFTRELFHTPREDHK